VYPALKRIMARIVNEGIKYEEFDADTSRVVGYCISTLGVLLWFKWPGMECLEECPRLDGRETARRDDEMTSYLKRSANGLE
jgi:hypothetical protein